MSTPRTCVICGERESANPAFAGLHAYGPVADHDWTPRSEDKRRREDAIYRREERRIRDYDDGIIAEDDR